MPNPCQRWLVRLAVVSALVVIVGLAFANTGPSAGLTETQIAEITKPATVMVWLRLSSTASFRKPQYKPGSIVLAMAQAQQQKGKKVSEEAIVAAILDMIARSPEKFLILTNKVERREVEAFASGSGFIVHPDGYVVTNAHVVATDEAEAKYILENSALEEIIVKEDLPEFQKQINFNLTREMRERFIKAELPFYRSTLRLGKVHREVAIQLGAKVAGVTFAKAVPADIRIEGAPSPGKDVAVLKVEQRDLPTVPLGDDRTLRDLDPVYIIGYPGAATRHEYLAQESSVEATSTGGHISARKKMPGGWDILQTDAAIGHGNSGGPAFNAQGEVIGLATFGSQEGNSLIQGMNFLVPVTIAKQFLHEINVEPAESRLTRLYREGVLEFDAQHYKRALEKFKAIDELNPGFPYISQKIAAARLAIDQGRDRSMPMLPYNTIATVIVALAIVIAGGFLLVRRHSAAARPAETVVAVATAVRPSLRMAAGAEGMAVQAAPLSDQTFGTIQCTSGGPVGRRFLISRGGLLIGRDSVKCQIVLPDDAVSKEHAWIVPVEEGVVVIDRGSTNGIYVNSTDAPRVSKVRLQHGDRIYIGKGSAVFTYLSS